MRVQVVKDGKVIQAIADPATMSDEQAERYTETMLGIAARRIAAENELWAKVEELALAGESGTVARIAGMHKTTAAADILAALKEGRLK